MLGSFYEPRLPPLHHLCLTVLEGEELEEGEVEQGPDLVEDLHARRKGIRRHTFPGYIGYKVKAELIARFASDIEAFKSSESATVCCFAEGASDAVKGTSEPNDGKARDSKGVHETCCHVISEADKDVSPKQDDGLLQTRSNCQDTAASNNLIERLLHNMPQDMRQHVLTGIVDSFSTDSQRDTAAEHRHEGMCTSDTSGPIRTWEDSQRMRHSSVCGRAANVTTWQHVD